MKIIFAALMTTMTILKTEAQKPADSIPGIYYIHGVMEVGTGVQLNKDSTFQFFFAYGALDRVGSGTWSYKNNTVILNTRKRPPSDFVLVESKKVPGDKIMVQMGGNNPMVVSNVNAVLTTPKTTLEANSNQRGAISFPVQDAKKLSLLFMLCPDRYSDFPVNNSHNYYKFNLQPWITEIFLEDFKLKLEVDGNLSGEHPIMDKPEYTYEKSNEKLEG